MKPRTGAGTYCVFTDAKLVGQTVGTTAEQFDSYVRTRFIDWMNANRKKIAFETPRFTSRIASVGGLETEAVAVPRTWRGLGRRPRVSPP